MACMLWVKVPYMVLGVAISMGQGHEAIRVFMDCVPGIPISTVVATFVCKSGNTLLQCPSEV